MESRIACEVDFERVGKQSGYLRVPHSVNESAYGTVLIPIWVIGNDRGPTIFFTGGVHGDEFEGPIGLMKTARRLEPTTIKGRVIIIPCVNSPAVLAGTRLSPLDNLNLNRVFPGDRCGSVTMMIAHFIDTLILPMTDYQVDLHSGGKTLEFLPTVFFKESADKARQRQTLKAALAFGAPYTLLNRDLDETGLLDSSCETKGILHVGAELGGAGKMTRESVALTEMGIMNLLRYFHIVEEPVIDPESMGRPPSRLLEIENFDSYVMASDSGILEPFLDLGDVVSTGQPIGQTHFPDCVDRPPAVLKSANSGFLLGRRPLGNVCRGDNVAVVARPLDATSYQ